MMWTDRHPVASSAWPDGPAMRSEIITATWSDVLIPPGPPTLDCVSEATPREFGHRSVNWMVNSFYTDLLATVSVTNTYARPNLSQTPTYFAPSELKRFHKAFRNTTAFERSSLEQRLESEARSLSSARLTDFLKLLEGRPMRRCDDPQGGVAQQSTLLSELRAIIKRVSQVAPVGAIAREASSLVIEAIRAELRHRKARLRKSLQVREFVVYATANTRLDSEIMRHGPPLSPHLRRTLPGEG